MDPTKPGPEEYGQAPRSRPPRETLAAEFGQHTPAVARTFRLVSGDDLLTVNPVDGSEVESCPPQERPGRPEKHPADERAGLDRAARPPVPPGPRPPRLPLLERDEERERLVRLLARGRSVRLTGPSGSGRTALLDLVAEDCADLAPDGVIRLSGLRRTPGDLLHELCAAVHRTAPHRPGPRQLLDLVREIGAVVVLDDLEFGGDALDELLDATPECAFLLAATPGVPAPSAASPVEEVFLRGLDRAGSLELLERAVGRVLTEEESNWAGDLWFESEGLPLRFMQAGALLQQRDRLRADADAFDEFGAFQERPVDTPFEAGDGHDVPLPSLSDGVAPAALLASRLSASARETLRFAVALAGEVPHQAHLPALVGDTHADAALGELVSSALVTSAGSRYRLAVDVQSQLEGAGYAEGVGERAATAAQHYSWWAGHPSVTPDRVCAEADAVLAALAVLTPLTTSPDQDEESAAVLLARRAAPAFAAGLHWGAWERALRAGAEAARLAGQVADQAYFHHELGVLALLTGQFDRARAELETSVGLRGALADKRGTIAGRRALALVADRSGMLPEAARDADTRREEFVPLPAGATAPASGPRNASDVPTLVAVHADRGAHRVGPAGRLAGSARRNAASAGAGALLVAVLGTVVTLGATTDNNSEAPSEKVGVNPSASVDSDVDDDLDADRAKKGSGDAPRKVPAPTDPGPDGTYGTLDDPTPTRNARPSGEPSGTEKPKDPTKSPTRKPTRTPTRTPSHTPSPAPSGSPSTSPSTSPSPDPSDPPPPEGTTTAGGPPEATVSADEASPEGTVM